MTTAARRAILPITFRRVIVRAASTHRFRVAPDRGAGRGPCGASCKSGAPGAKTISRGLSMTGLALFNKGSDGRRRTIASWHSPHSVTWRWLVRYQWRSSTWLKPSKWLMACRMVHNSGGEAVACIGPLALTFVWQKPTWYRDIYLRMRDERDGLSCPSVSRSPSRQEGTSLH